MEFISTLPGEEWERYQMKLRGTLENCGVWNRVDFMDSTCDVIQRYGTQSVKRVELNQPIICKVLGN